MAFPKTFKNKRVALCVSFLFMISCFLITMTAAAASGPMKVFVDLEELEFDAEPLLKEGTTLVPFRPLFEAMGMEVVWNQSEQSVVGKNEELIITLKIGEKTGFVNEQELPLLQAPEVIDARTYVPLRFIGETTGSYVVWDPYNRDINIVTEPFMEANHLTVEMLEEAMADYFAEKEEELASKEDETPTEPAEKDEQIESSSKPAAPVDLNHLEGMYYGWRSDFGGYECGGMCWDFYTFFPENKVLIGVPENGGPETIDCATEECLNYKIADGELKLSNGKSLPIKKSDNGFLTINDVQLDLVQPVADGFKLDNKYVYLGYRGLIGVDAAASSWTYYLILNPDGTFETSNTALGSLGSTSNPSTHVGIVDGDKSGVYEIKENTITLKYDNDTVENVLFFIHNDNPEGKADDIQFGTRNYYVKD